MDSKYAARPTSTLEEYEDCSDSGFDTDDEWTGDLTDDDTPELFAEIKQAYNLHKDSDIEKIELACKYAQGDNAAEEFEDILGGLCKDKEENKKSCGSCAKPVRIQYASRFEPGQHIAMPGQIGTTWSESRSKLFHLYKHHAIVKKVKYTSGTAVHLVLIHFQKQKGTIKIFESLESYDLKTHEMYEICYCKPRYTAEKIIQRAESMLPENNFEQKTFLYNPLTCNCEHFATWCVNGEGESFQVQGFRRALSTAIHQLFGYGSKIAKLLLKLAFMSSSQIAAGLSTAMNVPEQVIGVTSAVYLVYCIVMTVLHIRSYMKDTLCKSCMKRQIMDLWLSFGLYGAITTITFLIINFALPLVAPPFSIPLGILVVMVSVGLQMSIGKVKEMLKSPFTQDTSLIEKVSDLQIGDVIQYRYYGFQHSAILADIQAASNSLTQCTLSCIHYGLSWFLGTRQIMEEKIQVNLREMKVKALDCRSLCCYSPEEVVRRARNRIGETKWSVGRNRSDHFCFWAKVMERPSSTNVEIENLEEIEEDEEDELSAMTRSSTFVMSKDVHHVTEIQPGDVVDHTHGEGIIINIERLDGDFGRKFKLYLIEYREWYGRCIKYTINLDKDELRMNIYHPAHCRPMQERVKRAKAMRNVKGKRWTTRGFILDCISRESAKR